MALVLRLRTRTRSPSLTNPSPFHHRLISTSNSGGGGGGDDDDPTSKSPFASYFRDVRDKLKQHPPPPSNPPSSSNSKNASINEIMNNLSKFRRRSSAPPPTPSQQFSFQALYNQNVLGKLGQSSDSQPVKPSGQHSLDAIRDRLQQLGKDQPSQGGFMSSPRLQKPSFTGGTGELPDSVFGRGMRRKGVDPSRNWNYFNSYSHEVLGKKLAALRPEAKGKEWFSLAELNERLMKMKEMDMNEAKSTGVMNSVIMGTLDQLAETDKSKKAPMQRIDMLGLLGGTPDYLMKPPKEHLVEKYFHPDNLSSAEKLKIELTKVRDEFKMSESDCGSARVQVAQLTTKIKHLSSVLHKKDVHSRKGLVAMVQKRKSLLKYLRRTDWDSYCFVISKLGLRDNPDHSHKIRTKAQSNEKDPSQKKRTKKARSNKKAATKKADKVAT